ncbi:PilW family protein [Alkalimonas collagenimarina]|uniref:PilW family protein n=1 Tax=Alkalimonas collagenimarina TaxID=400390 RepID=A0ABT9H0P5_9GAMM|nr:PilW family protein [Alkalimonas collagenimarina]MDP4536850.1 PilW family protein [Alkalimonas collagenimarina]
MKRPWSRQSGVSLVELMIAAALALSLFAILMVTTSRQQQMSRESMQLAMLQQQGQLLLNLLQSELQHIGFWAGFSLQHIDAAAASFNPVQGECISLPDDSGSFPRADLRLVPLYAELGSGSGISCMGQAVEQGTIIQFKRLVAQPFHYHELKENRYYLQIQPSGLTVVDSETAVNEADTEFWPYAHQLFYVQKQGDIPVLMRKRLIRSQAGFPRMHTDSLMDGVEVLYVELGVDTSQDGRANYFASPHQLQPEHWYQQHSRIVAISYYFIIRSLESDPGYQNDLVYPMGQMSFQAPGDHYRRLMLQSTLYFHNVNRQLQGG